MERLFSLIREDFQQESFFTRRRLLKQLSALEAEYYASQFVLPKDPENTQISGQKVIWECGSELSFDWNMTKILQAMSNIPHKIRNYSLADLRELFTPEEFDVMVNSVSGPSMTPTAPIVIMWFKPISRFYLLDGGHRLHSAYLNSHDLTAFVIDSDNLREFFLWPEYDRMYMWLTKFMMFCRENGFV